MLKWIRRLFKSGARYLMNHPEQFKSIIRTQLSLLHVSLYASRNSERQACARSFTRSLTTQEAAFLTQYLAYLQPSIQPYSASLFSKVLCNNPRLPLTAELQQNVIKQYTTQVLSSSNPLHRAVLEGYSAFFKVMSPELFTEAIVPLIGRFFKRNPEVSMRHVSFLLGQYQHPIDGPVAVGQILPAIIAAYDSSSVQMHFDANLLFAALAPKLSNTSLPSIVQKLATLTSSPNGRQTAAAGLDLLARHLAADTAPLVADAAVSCLIDGVKAETRSEQRQRLCESLSAWLRIALTNSTPNRNAHLSFFNTLLSRPADDNHPLYLGTLGAAFSTSGCSVSSVSEALVATLQALVTATQSQPNKCPTLVGAAYCLTQLGVSLPPEQLASLWSRTTLARLTDSSLVDFVGLITNIVLSGNLELPVLSSLAGLVCNTSRSVHLAVVAAFSRLAKTTELASGDYFSAYGFCDAFFPALLLNFFADSRNDTAKGITRNIFDLLKHSGLVGHLSSRSYASLSILLHHPSLISSQESLHHHDHPKFTNWLRLKHLLGSSIFITHTDSMVVDTIIREHLEPLFNTSSPLFANPVFTHCATASLTSIAAHSDRSFIANLVSQQLCSRLAQIVQAAHALPADASNIYSQPEGTLFEAPSAASSSSSSASSSSPVSVSRRQVQSLDQWEQDVLRRKQDSVKVQLTPAQKELVATQDALREKITALLSTLRSSCDLIRRLSIGAPRQTESQITSFLPTFLSVLAHPVLLTDSEHVLLTLKHLLRTCSRPFHQVADFAALMIFRFYGASEKTDAEQLGLEACHRMLAGLIRSLHRLCQGRRTRLLSGPSLAVCIPLFEIVVASTSPVYRSGYMLARPIINLSSSSSDSLSSSSSESLRMDSLRSISRNSLTSLESISQTSLSDAEFSTAIADIMQLCALHVAAFPQSDLSLPWGSVARILLSIFATSETHRSSARRALLVCADALEDVSELLDGLVSPLPSVRTATFQTLLSTRQLSSRNQQRGFRPYFPSKAVPRFWFGLHDVDPSTAELARTVRQRYRYTIQPSHLTELFALLQSDADQIRDIAADALVGTLEFLSPQLDAGQLLEQAIALFTENMESTVLKASRQAEWTPIMRLPESKVNELACKRSGASRLIAALASEVTFDGAKRAFNFIVGVGLLDTHPTVFDGLGVAGIRLIHEHTENLAWFITKCEDSLTRAPDRSEYDPVRESLVIFLGELAQFLDTEDKRKDSILLRLIATLDTPSQSVQNSVGRLIGPLARQLKSKTSIIDQSIKLLQTKLCGSTLVIRQGGAIGLTGIVKGLGTTALSHLGIHEYLLGNLTKPAGRLGSLLCFIELSKTFGHSFDAFTLRIFPQLLPLFAESSEELKSTANLCANTLVNNLSEFGANILLDPLLKGLDSSNPWRARLGCIGSLSTMAHCSPKQLATCLPRIVPRLQETLIDAHPAVNREARSALSRIGDVLTNQELKPKVPLLLATLNEPAKNLAEALESLIRMSFTTLIDPASLALIIPIIQLGTLDRRSEVKCKASRLAAGLIELVEHRVLLPYLNLLLTSLKRILLDPIPMVRATASFALGSLIRGLGLSRFSGLMDWLINTMESELGSVERDGAAQGLAQFFGAIDLRWLDGLLPRFLAECKSSNPSVREGVLAFFSFLPSTMETRFEKYLPVCLPSILEGLSDSQEPVRNVALRAARGIISQYSGTSMGVLLPALEGSMFNENWRIRQSTIQLAGDLIQQILDSDNARIVRAGNDKIAPENVLNELIGRPQRNALLAALAMCRQDSAKQVAQRAIGVWKDCVSHSTRALREIVPLLMQRIVTCLASPVEELRSLASNTLAMLISKLDQSLLTNIFPLFQEALENGETFEIRQGACVGLEAVMETASRHQVTEHLPSIVPCINKALCDEVPEVREAAARAFDVLCNRAGGDVLNQIIPPLLADLSDHEKKTSALEIFKQLVIVRPGLILPRLLPILTAVPITEFAARALSTLAEVAGAALYPHLRTILAAYVPLVGTDPVLTESLDSVLAAVKEEGVAILFAELNKFSAAEEFQTQLGAVITWGLFAARASTDATDWDAYIPSTLRSLLSFMTEANKELQTAALKSLTCLEKAIPKDEKPAYVPYIRDFFTEYLESHSSIVGFGLPRALDPLLSIAVAALLNGSTEQKVEAASCMEQLVVLTPVTALQPYMLAISGPLLRVLGLRAVQVVKEAIFQTINTFLAKGGAILRQLEAPLRATYLKALNDPADSVRRLGAIGLGHLQPIVSKIDPLVADLLSALKEQSRPDQAMSPDASKGILAALQNVLRVSGEGTSQKVRDSILPTLQHHLESPHTMVLAAEVLALTVPLLSDADKQSLLKRVLHPSPDAFEAYVLLCALLRRAPSIFESLRQTESIILSALTNETDRFTLIGLGCVNYLWFGSSSSSSSPASSSSSSSSTAASSSVAASSTHVPSPVPNTEILLETIPNFLPHLIAILLAASDSLKLTTLDVLKKAIKSDASVPSLIVKLLAPALMECIKDRKSVPVKMAAERTLLHLLQLRTDRLKFASHMSQLAAPDVRSITDYVKRVLVKLAPTAEGSDNETADDELGEYVIQ